MSIPRKLTKSTPPMKGSFPLDHKLVCEPKMNLYLNCLQQRDLKGTECRPLIKEYLQCRMEK